MAARQIHTLSGGQKQRLAIAGALASEAKLLLLDEPTALLDPSSQSSVLATVQQLCHRSLNPLTALWITHRLDELDHADGAALMKKGMVGPWEKGLPEQNPKICTKDCLGKLFGKLSHSRNGRLPRAGSMHFHEGLSG